MKIRIRRDENKELMLLRFDYDNGDWYEEPILERDWFDFINNKYPLKIRGDAIKIFNLKKLFVEYSMGKSPFDSYYDQNEIEDDIKWHLAREMAGLILKLFHDKIKRMENEMNYIYQLEFRIVNDRNNIIKELK